MAQVPRQRPGQTQVPKQQATQRSKAVAIRRSRIFGASTEDHDRAARDAFLDNPFLESTLDSSIIDDGVGLRSGDRFELDLLVTDFADGRFAPGRSGSKSWSGTILTEHLDLIADNPASICAMVEQQIGLEFPDEWDREIAKNILDELQHGLLPSDICDQIAAQTGSNPATVERVLLVMQAFDPPGVCARSIAESLEIQLRELGELTPAYRSVLDNLHHLRPAMPMKKFGRICGVQESQLDAILARLEKLNFFPDANAAGQMPPARIPDLLVVHDGYRILEAVIHPDATLGLKLDPGAFSESGPTKLAAKRREAHRHVEEDELFQTRLTLVGSELARLQEPWLLGKSGRPAPLTQKQLAKLTGLTEPEISRAVKGRTMDTPRGLMEMQSLFARPSGLDDAISELFWKLTEEGKKPTDRAIYAKLDATVYSASRRTVGNRRKALGLHSSMIRSLRTPTGGESPDPAV